MTQADDIGEYLIGLGYAAPKEITEGRVAALLPFLFTTAIVTVTRERDGFRYGYEDRWCYHTFHAAFAALMAWDGTGEPAGWHRHPDSGRRRDGDREWVAP